MASRIMVGPRGQSIELEDFNGGLNTFDPEYQSPLNQSPDLDNIVLLDKGFKKRFGDSKFNSSVMVSTSTPVVGAGYIQFNSGVEFFNGVAGTKFFTSSGLTGTMADATGALTITAGASNIWTPVNFNDLQIWFGGAPDAPFKYSGSGNGAALAGSAPSTYTAFIANNRVFAISTAAAPSRIYWCVLNNPEDWTNSGSGNADVLTSDGEALQCGIVNGTDTAILFKNSSTHLMVLTRQPFPIYQLQKGTGIAGRRSWAQADGVIYFVTPGRRMKSTTDGINFKYYPNDINDIWDSINVNRISSIVGYYNAQYERIEFMVSTGSSTTNNYCIIWDIRRQCFLRNTTGFKANVVATVRNRLFYTGNYDGTLYMKYDPTTNSDASEASPGTIDGYWRTPFKNLGGLDTTIHPLYFTISALTEVATVLELSYGFDFTSQQRTGSFSIVAAGGQWDVAQWDVDVWGGQNAVNPRMYVQGRGNLFSLKIRNAIASQPFTIQGCSVRLRPDKAQKRLTAI